MNGNTNYYDHNHFKVSSGARYDPLRIADISDKTPFQLDLVAHQQGKTSFPVFCKDCARSGIEKWMVNMDKMTCTYYDKAGNKILEEQIPY